MAAIVAKAGAKKGKRKSKADEATEKAGDYESP